MLLELLAAGVVVGAGGLVLARRPADADPEPQTTAAEAVDLGCLLGDEGGLAHGQDDDGGEQADALGDASDVGVEGQQLVMLGAVLAVAGAGLDADEVLEGGEVRVA